MRPPDGGSKRLRASRTRPGSRLGASAVEFAIVAPVFVLLILGMIEIGRAILAQQIITNAAREGARSAALNGATATSVTGAVNTYLSNASLPTATVTFPQGNPETRNYGDPVEVDVSIPFDQVSWISPFYLGGQNLTSSAVMRGERTN